MQAVNVSKDMLVSEVIEQFPVAADIMESYGLSCTGCSVNGMDTIEAGAHTHGMSDEQVTSMVNDINASISSGKAPAKKAMPVNPGVFSVTQKAASKMKEILTQQNKAEWGIRVQVSAGGCAGYMYGLDFAQGPEEGDKTMEFHGVKVFMDTASAGVLGGVTVDYVETLQEQGFKFDNPNAKGSCGCGQSFR